MQRTNEVPAIRIRKLQKSYGRQPVLDGIDLEIRRGETLAILGRSGTGKSVLLKSIIGLQPPDSGSIQVLGEEMVGRPLVDVNRVRRRMGFLFQNGALYDSLPVDENVSFPLRHHLTLTDDEIQERVRLLLQLVGMEKEARKMPSEISGGMRKRVGLARALALDPEVMLYDEPTAGLDPITSAEIEDLINNLEQERRTASIVVTHDMHCTKTISDRVAILDQGRIRFQGTFEEFITSGDDFNRQYVKLAL